MPTTPRRARLWLQARRARVVRRDPFTIQLRFETTSYTQPVTVGVDTGSKAVGLAALANGEVLVVGGEDSSISSLASAELYKPATGTWQATASMHASRWLHLGRIMRFAF